MKPKVNSGSPLLAIFLTASFESLTYKINDDAESSSQAAIAKEDAIRQVEKYKVALEEAEASAKKREEELLAQSAERENQLTNNLFPLAVTLSGEFL